jgi:protein SPT2
MGITDCLFLDNEDREVMRTTVKSKAPTSQPARVSNGYGSKNKMSTQRHAEGRVDTMRKEAFLNRERVVSRDNERMHERVVSRGNERMHGSAINGSNQASTSKTTIQKLTSRGSIANKQASTDLNDAALRKSSVAPKHHFSEVDRSKSLQSQKMQSAGQRLQHSSHGQRPHQSMQHRPQQSLQSRRPQQMTQDQKPQQSLQSQRTQQSLQNKRQQQSSHIQKLQSSHTQKSQSSQAHRPQSLSNRSQELRGQRPLSSQGQYLEQRRVQANDRVKQVERHIRPPSKSMVIFMRTITFLLSTILPEVIFNTFSVYGLACLARVADVAFIPLLSICACSHLDQSPLMEFAMIMQRESKW